MARDKFVFWRNDQAVDGAELTLDDHVTSLANRLKLDAERCGILVAELRNALVPVMAVL